MHRFDPNTQSWQIISEISAGNPPSPRKWHGFAAAGTGIYVLGGVGAAGEAFGPICMLDVHWPDVKAPNVLEDANGIICSTSFN